MLEIVPVHILICAEESVHIQYFIFTGASFYLYSSLFVQGTVCTCKVAYLYKEIFYLPSSKFVQARV